MKPKDPICNMYTLCEVDGKIVDKCSYHPGISWTTLGDPLRKHPQNTGVSQIQTYKSWKLTAQCNIKSEVTDKSIIHNILQSYHINNKG